MSDYNFELAALISIHGDTQQYIVTLPFSQIKRVIKFDDNPDVFQRSQRVLNKSKAKKVADYIYDNIKHGQHFIFPPLMGCVDQHVTFESFTEAKIGMVGKIKIPMDANIKLFDGQHRAMGIWMFLNDPKYKECWIKSVGQTFTLVLIEAPSLSLRQQFFTDINKNTSRPSTALSLAYNAKNPINALTMQITCECKCMEGIIDYENNSVRSKGNLLLSYKAINDATIKFFKLNKNSHITNELKDDAIKIWDAIAKVCGWENIKQPVEYRKNYLGTHGVMLNAFGLAVGVLLEKHNVEEVIAKIINSKLDFSYNEWANICIDPDACRVRADKYAQQLASQKLVDIFDRC